MLKGVTGAGFLLRAGRARVRVEPVMTDDAMAYRRSGERSVTSKPRVSWLVRYSSYGARRVPRPR